MEQRYAFCGICILISFASYSAVIDTFKRFYNFDVDKTENTTGVLTKVSGYDGDIFICKFKYNAAGITWQLTESVPYDTLAHYKAGDPVNVLYNVKHPSEATMKTKETRYWEFVLCAFIPAGFIYSIIILTGDAIAYIKRLYQK